MMEIGDLKEKYRPTNFNDFFGNDQVVDTLISFIDKKGGPPPAILLAGPRGCGKTTLAGIIKRELDIHDRDFKEMNNADDRGIDAVRGLRRECQFPPHKKTRLVFLDEAHKITNDAQNALLKLLEKPADHTRFVLATTDPQMLLQTVRSRCKILTLELLGEKDMRAMIESILKREGIKDFNPDAIDLIIKMAEGSPREAVDLLDTALVQKDDRAMLAAIERHNYNQTTIQNLCQALLKNEPWKNIATILKGLTEEPESVRYAVLGYMNAVLLNSGQKRAAEIIIEFQETFIYSKKAGLTLACFLTTGKK